MCSTSPAPDPAGEAEQQRQHLHALERWAASQPQQPGPHRPDPITVLRIALKGRPGELYCLARWSLAARLVRDAAEVSADTVEDLGPNALALCQAAQRGDFKMGELLHVGVAAGGRWLAWYPRTAPVEPVPGSSK